MRRRRRRRQNWLWHLLQPKNYRHFQHLRRRFRRPHQFRRRRRRRRCNFGTFPLLMKILQRRRSRL